MDNKSKNSIDIKSLGKKNSKQNAAPEKISVPFLCALIFFIVIVCAVISLTAERPTDIETTVETTEPVTQAAVISEETVDFSTIPESLVKLYNNNPDAKSFVLHYNTENAVQHEIDLSSYLEYETVPLFMQWDKRWGYNEYSGSFAALSACGPVCLSMVAFHLKKDASLTPVKMMEFAVQNKYTTNGNGSLWKLIYEGGEKLGLKVEELSLSEDKVISNLKKGNPVICIMGPGKFTTSGHFIVLKMYNDGKIWINDPNSYSNSARGWTFDEFKDEIKNMWALSV